MCRFKLKCIYTSKWHEIAQHVIPYVLLNTRNQGRMSESPSRIQTSRKHPVNGRSNEDKMSAGSTKTPNESADLLCIKLQGLLVCTVVR